MLGCVGDDDDDEPHDIFDAELNPLQLLQQMQMQSAGDPTALQPYQVLRTQKAATRRRQFHRDSDEEDDDEGTHEAMEVDEAGPGPSSRGTGVLGSGGGKAEQTGAQKAGSSQVEGKCTLSHQVMHDRTCSIHDVRLRYLQTSSTSVHVALTSPAAAD